MYSARIAFSQQRSRDGSGGGCVTSAAPLTHHIIILLLAFRHPLAATAVSGRGARVRYIPRNYICILPDEKKIVCRYAVSGTSAAL